MTHPTVERLCSMCRERASVVCRRRSGNKWEYACGRCIGELRDIYRDRGDRLERAWLVCGLECPCARGPDMPVVLQQPCLRCLALREEMAAAVAEVEALLTPRSEG
jgi:hypothetical protein